MPPVTGKRVSFMESGEIELTNAEYGRTPEGQWLLCPPNGNIGFIDPAMTLIQEHADGSVSFHCPLMFYAKPTAGSWEGKLIHGIWYEDTL